MKYTYSEHARIVMMERGISDELVDACIIAPDIRERHSDGTMHYCDDSSHWEIDGFVQLSIFYGNRHLW